MIYLHFKKIIIYCNYKFRVLYFFLLSVVSRNWKVKFFKHALVNTQNKFI